MTDLFTEDEDVLLDAEDEFVDPDMEAVGQVSKMTALDARRRWEELMEERRLSKELEDF